MIDQPSQPSSAYLELPAEQRPWYWSIYGPSLLDCDWSPATPSWLQYRQQWPQQTPDFTSPRLGFRFEHLWQQYFQLLGWPAQFNLQIRSPERTLGELDALIQTPNEVLHLELALKFYLGFGNDWIGPNRRDYLADKIRHTRERQLPLAHTLLARQHLPTEWQPKHSQALMRGCLFHPANAAFAAPLPVEVNDKHWQGRWCHIGDAAHYLPDGNWYIVAKPDWLSPVQAPLSVSRQQLIDYCSRHFQQLDSGLCVILLAPSMLEQQRWMLMPDHWPN